jgi:hypothetical protein
MLALIGLSACSIEAAQTTGPQNPGNAALSPSNSILPPPNFVPLGGNLPSGTPLSAYPEAPLAKLPPANLPQALATQLPVSLAPLGPASSLSMGPAATATAGFSRNQGAQGPWSYNNQGHQSGQATINPQENQRSQQLQLQYQGLNAFTDPSVQQNLNLTPAQVQKLQTYDNAQAQRWAEMYKSVGYNPDRAQASYQSMVGQNSNLIRQVLSPQQQRTFSNMTGAPAQFQPHWVAPKK